MVNIIIQYLQCLFKGHLKLTVVLTAGIQGVLVLPNHAKKKIIWSVGLALDSLYAGLNPNSNEQVSTTTLGEMFSVQKNWHLRDESLNWIQKLSVPNILSLLPKTCSPLNHHRVCQETHLVLTLIVSIWLSQFGILWADWLDYPKWLQFCKGWIL